MKKLFIILSLALFAVNVSNAQTAKNAETVFDQVDVLPEYPGGIKEMYTYIGKNIKYPESAVKANITGKVFVKMIIEKDGSINTTSIEKGIGFGCEEEVTRIVKAMPKWSAGIKDGKAVRTSYVLPVMFAMDNKKSK
ncbi:energy transducer TonB [Emticicia sp. SJ17W-69]|uniref:energy transducer TonB n=1 Tax=Emticicia sp. SJ17W-69 TaxID=3421657 RepID=UPI003EBD6DC4